jgi:hypothetical protein
LDGFLAGLQQQGEFDLIDARTWVPDDGFGDAHHLNATGARIFSTRFAVEILPHMRQRLVASLGHEWHPNVRS